ncbi:TPA: phosphotransferase, partial [Streptococcus suis]
NSGVDQEEYAYILTTYIFNNNNNNDIKKIASSYCDFIKKVNNNNLSLIPEKDRIYGKIVEDYGLISRNNCIIHGDIHIGNIIFGDNKVFFIDFENLSYTNIAFDIAALFETCNELNIANGYNLLEFLRLFKREGLFFSVSDVLFILFEIFRFEFEGDYLWKS